MDALTLIGEARPIAPAALTAALGDHQTRVPADYLTLLACWGAGVLCGVFELPDPTEADGRFAHLQRALRAQGPALRLGGHWAQLRDGELEQAVVLGVDRRGAALVARTPDQLVVLHPRGELVSIGGFDRLGAWLLRDGLTRSLEAHHRVEPGELELGVPANYVTDRWAARTGFLAALAAGDEAAADAALEIVLGTEVALYALLELAAHLAGPEAGALPGALRASYAEQCLRMAKRRAAALVKDVPVRELTQALAGAGVVPPALLDRVTILERPGGIFLGEHGPTEARLLDAIAADPDDAASRLVYADYLEQTGELARAEALRVDAAAAALPPIADAAERGFVALSFARAVDSAAWLRDHAARWRAEDPDTSVDALIAQLDALHPTARHGYVMLVDVLERQSAYAGSHLQREIADAWPALALALRSPDRLQGAALRTLVAARCREAAPFVLSVLRRPTAGVQHHLWEAGNLEAAYVQLGKADARLIDELAPYLTTSARPDMPPPGWSATLGAPRLQQIAFTLLQGSAADDRVFEGYLQSFCAAHPHSEQALKKRRKDPRVEAVLLAAFDHEEKLALRDGRHVVYSAAYGLLARYLARLGNQRCKEAAARYARFSRWGQTRERDF